MPKKFLYLNACSSSRSMSTSLNSLVVKEVEFSGPSIVTFWIVFNPIMVWVVFNIIMPARRDENEKSEVWSS